MQIEHSITITSDITTVWNIFTDLTCWKSWNTVAKDILTEDTMITEGKRFSFCIRPFALPMYIKPVVETVAEHHSIVWSGSKHGIHARHEFLFSETDAGVRITSRETFSTTLIRKPFFYFSRHKIHRLSVKMLEELKEAAEKGDTRSLQGAEEERLL